MQEELKKYLSNAKLQLSNIKIEERFVQALNILLEAAPNTQEDIERLLTYKVPKLGTDGNYSILDQLDETPCKLKEILFYNGLSDKDIYELVYNLNKVVQFLHKEIRSDWTGIYKKLNTETGPALVKLAYKGIASRVEFPLTKEFAKH